MKEFEALGLSSPVLSSLAGMGFETPTEIQKSTIPILLTEQVDFIGLAQTGTGKTAAFGLPLIELIDVDHPVTQAVILAPTRELAQQIASQIESFSNQNKKLKVVCVFGGANIQDQIRKLRRGAHIIVATPGRLIDLNKRGEAKLNEIDYVILDEADEMLNMGFKDELETILAQTPEDKLTWLFSATMPQEIKRIIKNFMSDPREVRINTTQRVNVNIEHQYAVIKASDKVEALRRIIDFAGDFYGVVFCRTKIDTQRVAEQLVETGYAAEALHGDLSQSQRDAVMKRFRAGTLQLLIATDVAARGIDVDNLTHVIHFALPDDHEYYVHRSGRTARAGKKGISFSLITKGDTRKLRSLEKQLQINFTKAPIPAGEEIAKNRIEHWANRLADELLEDEHPEVLKTAGDILQNFDKDQLIAKLVHRELENFKKRSSLSNLNDESREHEGGGSDRRRGKRSQDGFEAGMNRYFINVGRMDGMNPGALVRFICDNSKITGKDLGRISLENTHSYVDILEEKSGHTQSLNGLLLDGREVRINRDDGNSARQGKFKGKSKGKGKGNFRGQGRKKRR